MDHSSPCVLNKNPCKHFPKLNNSRLWIIPLKNEKLKGFSNLGSFSRKHVCINQPPGPLKKSRRAIKIAFDSEHVILRKRLKFLTIASVVF